MALHLRTSSKWTHFFIPLVYFTRAGANLQTESQHVQLPTFHHVDRSIIFGQKEKNVDRLILSDTRCYGFLFNFFLLNTWWHGAVP